jgi:hypothetical protein
VPIAREAATGIRREPEGNVGYTETGNSSLQFDWLLAAEVSLRRPCRRRPHARRTARSARSRLPFNSWASGVFQSSWDCAGVSQFPSRTPMFVLPSRATCLLSYGWSMLLGDEQGGFCQIPGNAVSHAQLRIAGRQGVIDCPPEALAPTETAQYIGCLKSFSQRIFGAILLRSAAVPGSRCKHNHPLRCNSRGRSLPIAARCLGGRTPAPLRY